MSDYYAKRLSASRLRQVYDLAPARVRQYLEAEIQHVIQRADTCKSILELGCGYGRVMQRLSDHFPQVHGIDTSMASLQEALTYLQGSGCCFLAQMDATNLGIPDESFDCVICIQNGISAFHVDPFVLLQEGVRVTRPGGLMLISTYSAKFWDHRLHWFQLQSDAGLIGPIDYQRTGDGTIVCTDGFSVTTVSQQQLGDLLNRLGLEGTIAVVDESSIFLEVRV